LAIAATQEFAMAEDDAPLDMKEDRRRFLQTCGRFAVTVPPAMTIMLSTSLTSAAIAASSGGGGGGGSSDGGKDGKGHDGVDSLQTRINPPDSPSSAHPERH
jgi:hypothetical protein